MQAAFWQNAVALAEVVDGRGQRRKVGNVIGAGIVAIEQVEELDEGHDAPALAQGERPADAQIHLHVRRSAELVESGLHAIHHGAVIK